MGRPADLGSGRGPRGSDSQQVQDESTSRCSSRAAARGSVDTVGAMSGSVERPGRARIVVSRRVGFRLAGGEGGGTAEPSSAVAAPLGPSPDAGPASGRPASPDGAEPARTGRRLRRAWGRVLTVASDEDAEYVSHAPPVPIGQIVRRFRPYLRGRGLALAATIALTASMPLVEMAEILLFKVVVDDILVPREFELFPRVALAYVLLCVLTGLLGFVEGMLSTWLSQRFLMDLRAALFAHLQRLSPDFFDRRRLGDLVTRVTGDTAAIEHFLVSGSQTFVTAFLRLIVFSVALAVLNWQLAAVSLLVTPLFWLVTRYFSRRIKAASREKRRRSGSMTVVVEESLRNTSLVQAYNRQGWEQDRLARASEAKYAAELASARLRGLFSPIIDGVELAGALIVIGVGTWQLAEGNLTIGGLIVFLTMLSRLYSPIRGLIRLTNTAYAASAAAERVIEMLDQEPRITEAVDARPVSVARPGVEFRDVSFSYPTVESEPSPSARRPALDSVSLRVAPGEVLALVGPSGAGKSTVARLLLRSYDPTSGQVLLGGEDLRALTLHSVRDTIAVVLQETLVFDGTVRDNIAYGRPGATQEQILDAARAADAHDFITALPDAYATRIGERGTTLSGGQRQRLAIARAMVRDAPVLLLDEPTTGLDPASGQRMLEPMRRLMAGRATIVISHNLLTVQDATTILVLDGGRVVERGTHEELLRQRGLYARLHRLSGLGGQGDGPALAVVR